MVALKGNHNPLFYSLPIIHPKGPPNPSGPPAYEGGVK